MTGTLRKNKPGPWILVHGLFLYFYRRAEQRAEAWTPQPVPWLCAHLHGCCSPFLRSLTPCKDLHVWLSVCSCFFLSQHTQYMQTACIYVCTYTLIRRTHTQAQAPAARPFIFLADRKCFAQLNSAKAGTVTADLLTNKVKWQKENFSLVTQLRKKQYSH